MYGGDGGVGGRIGCSSSFLLDLKVSSSSSEESSGGEGRVRGEPQHCDLMRAVTIDAFGTPVL